jgi:hypothetical protein
MRVSCVSRPSVAGGGYDEGGEIRRRCVRPEGARREGAFLEGWVSACSRCGERWMRDEIKCRSSCPGDASDGADRKESPGGLSWEGGWCRRKSCKAAAVTSMEKVG